MIPIFHGRVKPSYLFFLLSLCQAGSAAAIGLGEITLRSHLGQPLHASIAVLGATPELTVDCFRIVSPDDGTTPTARAELRLERSGGQAVLHIRTPQPINDLIAQFAVIAECEGRLQRDYVVLLDPPALAPQVVPAVSMEAASAKSGARPATATPIRSVPPKTARIAASPLRKPVKRPPLASTPRLVLSGKALVEETPQRTPPSPKPSTAAAAAPVVTTARPSDEALSDENTALTRKLAYLEAQLAALRQRNAELEAMQQRNAVSLPAPAAPEKPRWPLYLLAVALLGGGALLVAWLRRHNQSTPRSVSLHSPRPATPVSLKTAEDLFLEPLPAAEGSAAMPLTRPPNVAAPLPSRTEGTEVKEDILDQAEVFMAHGHGDFAVHLLQEHLREAPTESPVPWLLLLDLLHRAGDSAGYAAAAAECRLHFNINLSGHPVSQDGNDSGLGLEAYPHLLEKLVHVWNTPEIGSFFEDLVYDNRGGTRVGFDPGAYRDILLLRDIAQQALPLAA